MGFFLSDNWKRFILTICFWIFAWTLHDTIMERYELSNPKNCSIYNFIIYCNTIN